MSRRTSPKPPRTDVRVLSRWNGFCLPCGSSERPLVLVWTGPASARARLLGPEAGTGQLRLTCAVCGGTDLVGWEDEPELAVGWDEPVLDLTAPAAVPPVAVHPEPAVAPDPAVVPDVPHDVDVEAPAAATLEDAGLGLLLPEAQHVPVDDPADVPALLAPVVAEPVAHEPVAPEPVVSETGAFEPVAFEPVAFEPVAYEPVAYEPAVLSPAAQDAVLVPQLEPAPQLGPAPQVEPAPQPYVPGLSADVAAALRELAAPAVPAPRGSDDLEALALLDGDR